MSFEKCSCPHCGQHIEYPSEGRGQTISCPNCEQPVALPITYRAGACEISIRSSGRDGIDAERPPGWGTSSATPKQVAFLTYMGFPKPERLTKKEASDLIDSGGYSPEARSMAEMERQQARKSKWHIDRLVLHPDLYTDELTDHLSNALPEQLHTYVRGQIVGASEKLTKSRILDVVQALNRENSRWWHQPQYEAVFVERLRQMYPGCCDGRSLEVKRRPVATGVSPPAPGYPVNPVKTGGGCLVLVVACFLVAVLCVLLVLQ